MVYTYISVPDIFVKNIYNVAEHFTFPSFTLSILKNNRSEDICPLDTTARVPSTFPFKLVFYLSHIHMAIAGLCSIPTLW